MEKTKFLRELQRPPVATGKRRAVPSKMVPMVVSEESAVAPLGYSEREEYRFDAHIGAYFYRTAREPEIVKSNKYRELLRAVSEGVYGEVRAEIYRLLPRVNEITDFELAEDFAAVLSGILEMTKPD